MIRSTIAYGIKKIVDWWSNMLWKLKELLRY